MAEKREQKRMRCASKNGKIQRSTKAGKKPSSSLLSVSLTSVSYCSKLTELEEWVMGTSDLQPDHKEADDNVGMYSLKLASEVGWDSLFRLNP